MLKERNSDFAGFVEPDRVRKEVYTDQQIFEREMERIHETVWKKPKGSNVCSPVYHAGHVYWASDSGGVICSQDAATGETVYQERQMSLSCG